LKLPLALLALTALAPLSFAADKSADQEPVAWGMLTQNTGCVIFAQGHKTSGRFYGVAVTTKTVGKLTVLESIDYKLDQKEYLETQEAMDDLTRLAQKDHIKFVKIPEKHSPELLEKARALCKQD